MKLKTKFASYAVNGIPEGCKYCVRGEKLVVFISGKCSRNCWYCSLSNKRKNKDVVWINERKLEQGNIKGLLDEARESDSRGAGITGGDPLLFLNRTLLFAKTLKHKFKKFHIHIYLPTKLVSREKLRKLSKYIDEVRFHSEFLINRDSLGFDIKKSLKNSKDFRMVRNIKNIINISDIEKIRLAGEFWEKKNIGIELPIIPDKKQEIVDFILAVKDYIGFVNLNEFEISETNFNYVTRGYNLNKDSYTIKGSRQAGLWILNKLKREKIKIHLCTAETKNLYQYKNRLLRHSRLPFGKRTKDGTVVYLVASAKLGNRINKKECFYDKNKNRLILSEKAALKLAGKIKIERVEEFPTYDRYEAEKEEIKTFFS